MTLHPWALQAGCIVVLKLCTVLVLRITHRKWKKIKQQTSMLPGPAVPGSSLVSLHILWAILSTRTVLPNVNCVAESTLNGHLGEIWRPAVEHGETLDYEAELCIVIAKRCRNVTPEESLDYVLG